MLDKIKRNAFLIAAGFLMWQGWSATQAQATEEASDARPLPTLRADDLRGPDSPPSPYAIGSASAAGAGGGGGANGESVGEEGDNGPAVTDPFRVLRESLAKQEAAMAELGVQSQAGDVVPGGVPGASELPSQAILQLQSTLKPPRGEPTAIINGQILRVGETLSGFDDDQPPLLVEVAGTKAVLRYDGNLITLDVAGTASVAVDR